MNCRANITRFPPGKPRLVAESKFRLGDEVRVTGNGMTGSVTRIDRSRHKPYCVVTGDREQWFAEYELEIRKAAIVPVGRPGPGDAA